MSIKNKHREMNEADILGMKLGHIMEDAEAWWDKRGREIFRNREFSGATKEQQAALNASNPVHPNYIGGVSGIMLGQPWVFLTKDERNRVAMTYAVALKRMSDGEYNKA